jgi:hypothetical protein
LSGGFFIYHAKKQELKKLKILYKKNLTAINPLLNMLLYKNGSQQLVEGSRQNRWFHTCCGF